jgi:hypothetical protein
MLLMLEDNADRIRSFSATLARIEPALPLRIWRNAWTMIREAEPLLPHAFLISLDHDLDPEEGDSTSPGTGWDVTKHLATLPPVCPLIIHTSNGERATWMSGEFDLAGWKYYRVPPIGDDWIEHDWGRKVRRLLKRRRE